MSGAAIATATVLCLAVLLRTAPAAVSTVALQHRCRTLHRHRPPLMAPRAVPVPRWLSAAVARAGVGIRPEVVAAAWWAVVVVAAGGGWAAGGIGSAAIAAIAAIAAPVLVWPTVRDRSRRRYDAALPSVLESVAASLRSGAAPTQAIAEAASSAPAAVAADLRTAVLATERGRSLAAALDAWSARRDAVGVRLAVAAISLGLQTGGAQGVALDGVAATLRQRQEVEAEARALGTQARVSALVIAAAPPGFGIVAGVADAQTAEFLLRTPVGLAVLAVGLVLDAAGAVWMASLTRSLG